MGKKKRSKIKSECCNAPIKVCEGVGDFSEKDKACTLYAVCSRCGNPCDIKSTVRKVWTRNPKTQIKGDKRAKQKKYEEAKEAKSFTHKEIEEIRHNEDF